MNKNTKFVIKLGVILFVICAVCVFILAFCNNLTKDTIEKINIEKQENARKEVLKDADIFEKIEYDGEEEVYKGKKGDEIIGYCVKVSPKGFGGNIDMMVGLDNNLTVTDISIINMSETPGLGSKASSKEFTGQFKGLGEGIQVIKSGYPKDNEIVAISGATVTSKAVTGGINDAIEIVKGLMEVAK